MVVIVKEEEKGKGSKMNQALSRYREEHPL